MSTENEAWKWLYSDPYLLAECKDFDEFCDRKKAQGDRLANFYRGLPWLGSQLPYAKRYPNNPLNKCLVFPAVDKLEDLIEDYLWQVSSNKDKPKGMLFISIIHAKTIDRDGHWLYVKVKPEIEEWVKSGSKGRTQWSSTTLKIVERSDGLLVLWNSGVIISSHWIALMDIEQINNIPKPPVEG
jgi:hypothetical protein